MCIRDSLKTMQRHGYIGEFEVVDDHRSGKILIELNGRLNKCGVISPRFDIKAGEYEKWLNNILPSRQFGYLVVTTTYGIMDHEEAKKRGTGGKILGFFYQTFASPVMVCKVNESPAHTTPTDSLPLTCGTSKHQFQFDIYVV
eukprot:TRINITY_DN3797_c0_g3_i2.p2 TRINITY_DN3797_c0_g3~~TRINITY_DN3797_c0_g3_i2.p2  ORF type:complete len:143 (-),score=42.98 TRINITY_DN3797_c0_g3_i2:118-546(-)